MSFGLRSSMNVMGKRKTGILNTLEADMIL
jgi:hypothetical protein